MRRAASQGLHSAQPPVPPPSSRPARHAGRSRGSGGARTGSRPGPERDRPGAGQDASPSDQEAARDRRSCNRDRPLGLAVEIPTVRRPDQQLPRPGREFDARDECHRSAAWDRCDDKSAEEHLDLRTVDIHDVQDRWFRRDCWLDRPRPQGATTDQDRDRQARCDRSPDRDGHGHHLRDRSAYRNVTRPMRHGRSVNPSKRRPGRCSAVLESRTPKAGQ
jgi:hypothetical protein